MILKQAIDAALTAWYGRGDWKSTFFPADKRGGVDWQRVEEAMRYMGSAIEAADRVRGECSQDAGDFADAMAASLELGAARRVK